MNIADLIATLRLNIDPFTQGMRQATQNVRSWANNMQATTRQTNRNTGLMGDGFKDVGRIVQGIFVSKAIYGTLNAIKDITASVWEFSNSMEYAEMSYSNLFKNPALAKEFMNVLQDFSAVSPFKMGEIEKSTRMLNAYGIQAKNLLFITQGVLKAAAGQGNSNVLPQITRAIGQIYTKGVLKAEEARQLAEAGIPVYQILQEKLGLTAKQLGDLGNQAIPANKAINALVDGINERFGNLLEDSAKTVQGLISNIQDNLLILGSELNAPITKAVKDVLTNIGSMVSKFREAITTQGVGGLLEAMFPPSIQKDIRVFIANIMILAGAIKGVFVSALRIVKALLPGILLLLNSIGSIASVAAVGVSYLTDIITKNAEVLKILTGILTACAAAWLIWKAQAIAAGVAAGLIKVFSGIASAVAGLIRILSILATHPVWALLTLAGGVLFGLAASTGKWRDSVNGVLGSLTKISGIDTNKLLLPSQKNRTADLGKFNQRLGETGKEMDNLAKKTGKAAKAASGLQSFDEVFTIKELDQGAGSDLGAGLDDALGNLDLGGALDNAFPSPAEISTWAQNFWSKLLAGLDAFKDSILSAGIGAILGAVLGGLIGGPLGAKIGAILGGLAGWLWSKLAEQLGLSNAEALGIEIGAGLGAAIGYVIGGPAGAIIGAAIGALVGWIGGLLYDGFVNNNWNLEHLAMAIGTALGAVIGLIVGGPAGAVLGAAIGALVGYIGTLIIDGFQNGNWNFDAIGVNIAGLLGFAIGAIAGGPAGAAIGIAIGSLVGFVGGELVKGFTTGQWNFSVLTPTIGLGIGAAIGAVAGGPAGAVIGAAIGTLIGWIIGQIQTHWGDITKFFDDAWNGLTTSFQDAATKAGTIWDGMKAPLDGFFTHLGEQLGQVAETLKTWWTNLYEDTKTNADKLFAPINKVLTDIKTAITQVNTDIFKAVSKVWSDLKDAVSKVLTDLKSLIDLVWGGIKDIIALCMELVFENVKAIWMNIYKTISGALDNINGAITTIWNGIWTFLSFILSTLLNLVIDVWSKLLKEIDEHTQGIQKVINDIWTKIKLFLFEILQIIVAEVKEKFQLFQDYIVTPVSEAYDKVVTFFGDMYQKVKNSIGDLYTAAKDGITNIYKVFTDWIANMWDNVFNKLFGWLDDGISKLKDFLQSSVDAQKAANKASSEKNDPGVTSTGTIRSGSKTNNSNSGPGVAKVGHALGGVFNRHHWAEFAEGNKAEAIIPLENESAMKPFTDVVSNSVIASLAPIIASMNNSNPDNLRPLYVNTLIADDRGLRELQRQLKLIETQESVRGLYRG